MTLFETICSVIVYYQRLDSSKRRITQGDQLKLKDDIIAVVSEGLKFNDSYKILLEKKEELKKIGNLELPTFSKFEARWIVCSRKTIGRMMNNNGVFAGATSPSNTMAGLAALVTFLTVQTDGKFYAGAFNLEGDDVVLAGNIDTEGITIPNEQEDEEEQVCAEDDVPEGSEDEDDIALEEEQQEKEAAALDAGESSCVIPPGEINPFTGSLDKETLLKMGSEFEAIAFNENEMVTMFNNIMNMYSVSKPIDTVFWCPNLASNGIEEKLIEVMFLDGT